MLSAASRPHLYPQPFISSCSDGTVHSHIHTAFSDVAGDAELSLLCSDLFLLGSVGSWVKILRCNLSVQGGGRGLACKLVGCWNRLFWTERILGVQSEDKCVKIHSHHQKAVGMFSVQLADDLMQSAECFSCPRASVTNYITKWMFYKVY